MVGWNDEIGVDTAGEGRSGDRAKKCMDMTSMDVYPLPFSFPPPLFSITFLGEFLPRLPSGRITHFLLPWFYGSDV